MCIIIGHYNRIFGLTQNNYENIDGENFDEIYDLFAEILFRGISFQLKQGLHKEYISIHETIPTLKGKMDMRGTINNLIQKKQKIDCDFDELSENNLFNVSSTNYKSL